MYYSYYQLDIKLLSSMLGTVPNFDIMTDHLLAKTKKLIKEANKTGARMNKKIEKYLGTEITDQKEYQELCGIVRSYEEILGEKIELPPTLPELMELNRTLSDRCTELSKQDELKCTIFMKDETGHAVISTHVLLGNVKEILRTLINTGTKDIFKSKTQMGEVMSMDLKIVEQFVKPSSDIIRDPETKERVLNVRPIRFKNTMGESITALAASEELPQGTEMTFTLRIRKDSPIDNIDTLHKVFSYGRNLGLGAWRSSGQKGNYCFKIKALENFKETFDGGWN